MTLNIKVAIKQERHIVSSMFNVHSNKKNVGRGLGSIHQL